MGEWDAQVEAVEGAGLVAVPWVADAVRWLDGVRTGPVRRVLDLGAGTGHAAVQLALGFPEAVVTAVEPTGAIVDRARQRFTNSGLGGRLRTAPAGLGSPQLADLGPADLVWVAHVVHHRPHPVAALAEIGGLVADTGLVAVVEGGLPVRMLPAGYGVGRPSFVSRLDAALSDYFVEEWNLAEAVVGGTRDWPRLIAESGLRHQVSRTFVLDHRAPLSPEVRAYAVGHLAMVQDLVGSRLAPADAAALARLIDPDDPVAAVNRPDLFWLTAVTVHVATAGDRVSTIGPHQPG